MAKRLLPLAAMEKVMKNAGAERVSDSAKEALKSILEEEAEILAKKAISFADHAGRKTVKESDIRLAVKQPIS